jgi:hypothetical protein
MTRREATMSWLRRRGQTPAPKSLGDRRDRRGRRSWLDRGR